MAPKEKTSTKKTETVHVVDVKNESASTPVTVPVKDATEKKDCHACVGGLYTKNTETGEQVICKFCKGTTKI